MTNRNILGSNELTTQIRNPNNRLTADWFSQPRQVQGGA